MAKFKVGWMLCGSTDVEAESQDDATQKISDMSNRGILESHDGHGIDLEFTFCEPNNDD